MNRRRALVTVLPSASGFSLPYTDSFTAADGALPSPWTGATWTVSSSAVLNTPSVGSELVTNGTFDSDISGWTNLGGFEYDTLEWLAGKIHLVKSTAGSKYAGSGDNIALVTGGWYRCLHDVTTGTGTVGVTSVVASVGGTQRFQIATGGASGSRAGIFRSANTENTAIEIFSNNNGDYQMDNFSVKLITLASAFATLPATVASVTAEIVVTVNPTATKSQAGHVVNLDNIATPANFVIGYLDGLGNAKMDKCVSGTYTNLVSGAVTFGAAKVLKVVKNGNTYQLFYDGAQVGTDQTIANMNGTIHGLFSTHSTAKFDSYQLAAT